MSLSHKSRRYRLVRWRWRRARSSRSSCRASRLNNARRLPAPYLPTLWWTTYPLAPHHLWSSGGARPRYKSWLYSLQVTLYRIGVRWRVEVWFLFPSSARNYRRLHLRDTSTQTSSWFHHLRICYLSALLLWDLLIMKKEVDAEQEIGIRNKFLWFVLLVCNI